MDSVKYFDLQQSSSDWSQSVKKCISRQK